MQSYSKDSFADCINASYLGIRSLYQVTHLQLYFWTSLFGTHPVPWLLLMTGLHAAAHLLAFHFLAHLLEDLRVPRGRRIALAGVGIALLAPGASEVVVFKAAYHYPIALISLFGILLLLRQALVEDRRRPLVFALLVLAYRWANVCTTAAARRAAYLILLAMALLFAGHMALLRAVADGRVPHTQKTVEMALDAPLETLGTLALSCFMCCSSAATGATTSGRWCTTSARSRPWQ